MFAPPDDAAVSYSCSYKLYQTYKSPRVPPKSRPSAMPVLGPYPKTRERPFKPTAKMRYLARKQHRSKSPDRTRSRTPPPVIKVTAGSEAGWPHAREPLNGASKTLPNTPAAPLNGSTKSRAPLNNNGAGPAAAKARVRQPLPPITQGRTLLPRNPRGRRPDALPKSAR